MALSHDHNGGSIVQALVLAAGMGTRIGGSAGSLPKTLLSFGDGITILDAQLAALRENSIEDVVIVTGYRADLIEAKVTGLDDVHVTLVYNPFFRTTNNLISFWLALPYIDGEFISINGDNVFHPDILSALLNSRGDIIMTVARKEQYDDDDMRVTTRGEQVIRVGKDIPIGQTNGESLGIIKFSTNGHGMMRSTLLEMVRDDKLHSSFYLRALQQMMTANVPVRCCEVRGELWAEIDFPKDLAAIEQMMSDPKQVLSQWLRRCSETLARTTRSQPYCPHAVDLAVSPWDLP